MTERSLSCQDAVEQLWAFIDGELEPAQQQQVHEHLEACRACYPHYDFQKAFCAFLRRCSREKVSPELRRRIFLRLLAEEARQAGSASGDLVEDAPDR